jgi:membrane dipeptidase
MLARLVAAAAAGTFSAAAHGQAPALPPAAPADLGLTLSAQQRAAGEAFVLAHATVDMHAHPGRFFLDPGAGASPLGAPFVERSLADLNGGHVGAALFAAVADMRLLEITTAGVRARREFAPGEAYADYHRQITQLNELVRRDLAIQALTPADIRAASLRRRTAAVFSVEGGDFIEDRLERISEAHRDGVRAITLVHYHVNQIGDLQTEAPVHNGLTALGKSVINEMNAAGIIVDLAHATFQVAQDAVQASSRPMIISHTNLLTRTANFPRLISLEHAKLVADAGGVIGSWPSGFGQATFADYIDSILRLVEAVGIDHVGVGTDMDANYRPVFATYRDWSLIPGALLARGLDARSVGAIMGENFLRVFQVVQGGTPAPANNLREVQPVSVCRTLA